MPIATFHFEIVPLRGYNDDRFTKEDTFSICEENLPKTRRLYNKLGFDRVSQIFPIHLEKAQMFQHKELEPQDFCIDSVKMIVTLTQEKKQKLKILVFSLLRINKPTISYLAKVTAIIISCMPAAKLGPLFYCYLENYKVTSLRLN